ncbi:MAG: hypothetical protein IBX49_04275 [Gammaproteobacteria bacterium]|nr:hypothetical protein [Gammaproteobacteria bacterium]
MEIINSPVNPYLLPAPERRDNAAYGQRDTRAEERQQEGSSTERVEARAPTRPVETGPDIQQLLQRSRLDQARQDGGTSYRMGSEPLPVQRALDAYQDQIIAGQRYLGEGELMPRIDAYV